MEANKLKSILTTEQIIYIMNQLGGDGKRGSRENEMTFKTICHDGSSHKLYFYLDSKKFHCYTNCGSTDIINIVKNFKNISFSSAIYYIINELGINDNGMKDGFEDEINTSLDLVILDRYKNITHNQNDMTRKFKEIEEGVLSSFYKYYHPSFYNDGIEVSTLYKYGIRYDVLNQRVIIPHRDENNKLIAVRCRNFAKELVDSGFKYMPITINNVLLSAMTSKYLYGLNFNKENIKMARRIILVESEKSVMQLESILKDNNISVALMSSNLSLLQVELIKELGVQEVIVALDKEYKEYGTKEEKLYAMKIRKGVLSKLTPYFSVSIMWDKDNLIDYKSSPTDKGKEIFIKMYKEKININ